MRDVSDSEATERGECSSNEETSKTPTVKYCNIVNADMDFLAMPLSCVGEENGQTTELFGCHVCATSSFEKKLESYIKTGMHENAEGATLFVTLQFSKPFSYC